MLDNSRTEYGEALELGECFECRTAPDARIIIGNGAKIGNRSLSISIIPATCSVLLFKCVSLTMASCRDTKSLPCALL